MLRTVLGALFGIIILATMGLICYAALILAAMPT